MNLAIAITTYNRESTLIKTLHHMCSDLLGRSIGVAIHADTDTYNSLPYFVNQLREAGVSITYTDGPNEGVFRSKMKSIAQALEFNPKWIMHMDDDDFVNIHNLTRVVGRLESAKLFGELPAMHFQLDTTRYFDKDHKFTSRFIENKLHNKNRNAVTLNGLLLQVTQDLKDKVLKYPTTEMYNWGAKSTWADDTLTAGYLVKNVPVKLIDITATNQNYFDEDYHIVNDKSIPKMVRSYMREYIVDIPQIKQNYYDISVNPNL